MHQLEKDLEHEMWTTQTHGEKLCQLTCTPCMEAAKAVDAHGLFKGHVIQASDADQV